ncbi:hypothetical protein GCM10023107_01690 [Actinoplanes octamycinicus]
MVRDLNFQTVIHGVDTVREQDGLALSSRNVRLSVKARTQAPVLHKALKSACELLERGQKDVATLLKHVREHISQNAPLAKIDYIECVDAATLQP